MTHPIKTTLFTLAFLMLACLAPNAFAFTAVGNPNDTSANNGANLAAPSGRL